MACYLTAAEGIPGWKTLASAKKASGNCRVQIKSGAPYELLIVQKDGRQAKLTISQDTVAGVELVANGGSVPLQVRCAYPGKAASGDSQEVLVKIRSNEWTVYVDGALRSILAAPFVFPGSFAVPEAQAERVVGTAKFLPVANANFITNFMIEPGAPNELYPWNIQIGTWHLHTALQQAIERPETDQGRTKQAPLTADKSPNFYSLKGGGKSVDNVITAGYETYDNYVITAAMQPENGEAGVIIYHRDEAVAEGAKPDPAKAEFYAFTLRMNMPAQGMNEVRLWQQKNGAKRLIARAHVPMYQNQWYLPGIAAHGDEIICYLDHSELFRVKEQLPSGGKFGLFANTPKEIRMDDVTVKPFEYMDLQSAAGIRFNAQKSLGSVTLGGKALAEASGVQPIHLEPSSSIVIGRYHADSQVFSAKVAPQGDAWTLGLGAGWNEKGDVKYQFSIEHKPDSEKYVFSRIEQGKPAEVLSQSSLQIPWNGKEPEKGEFELMIDATQTGLLRCLKNGRVTLIWESPKDFRGAFELWTGNGTKADFRQLELASERAVFKELPQKNPVFQHDNFMRHWASPEGQWIAGKAKAMWHKGDFLGDYLIKLPCISGSELHVAVPDDKDDGPVAITINGSELTLTVNEWLMPDAKPQPQKITLTPPEGKGVDTLDYTVHHEGQWLWLEVNGKILAKHELKTSLRRYGTKARVRGLSLEHLARSKVTRSNVIDEYFNESPFMWLANGGDWQIINRFQCTPSWSHMIDEAYETMGAFWRKQIFSGDMTLEFYAGSRQGASYNLLGNYNCTIMASETSASTGYTATCTEWDHSHSQNWSRLYKNGKEMTKTNAYLAPRSRKGLYRRILNPLISQGRPYHGAWYYVKLRKIGDKLEYYFDDELIYTQHDKDVLTEGQVGIWTFLQSMTLAQIKITYDNVRVKPVPVTMLPLEEPKAPAPRNVIALGSKVNGLPVDALAASSCSVSDPVGQSTLTTFSVGGTDAQLFTNHLGAGAMTMSVKLPALVAKETAGLQFRVKRNAKARFNAFYSIASVNEKGEQKNEADFYHHISGSDFDKGNWIMSGRTDVPPVKEVTAKDGEWTTVNAWIPLPYQRSSKQFLVKFGGFGIEQQDELRNGIGGNGPGAAYAVADLVAVRWSEPTLELAEGESFKAYSDEAGKTPIVATTVPELLTALKSSQKPGVNTIWADISKGERTVRVPISWVNDSDTPKIKVAWDPVIADAIRVMSEMDYPHRMLARYNITCNKEELQFVRERNAGKSRLFTFPRTDKMIETFKSGKLPLVFTCDRGVKLNFEISTTDATRIDRGPRIVSLDGFTKFFSSFESGFDTLLRDGPKARQLRIKQDDIAAQGDYLMISNRGSAKRLEANFNTDFSIANYPIVQFRYRASDMAQVSMSFLYKDNSYVRLANDDWGNSQGVRLANIISFDEAWHSWTGIVTDAFCRTTTMYRALLVQAVP
ncbi:MAG: hypothetical protein J6X55_09340, partial [Victivallales bacterium]|nr:hypothetical protein [Victivallales bacterium]